MPSITFDFHNTLANCDPWFALEVRDLPWAVVSHLGLPGTSQASKDALDFDYAALRRRVVDSGTEINAYDSVHSILEANGHALEHRTIDTAIDDLMRSALTSLQPALGAVDTIHYLHAMGCRLGVISSAVHHPFVEWSICKMDLDAAFASIVTSASAGYYKSSPRIFARFLCELGAEADWATHVGDSLRWDVVGAQRAGMRAVWLDTGRLQSQSFPESSHVVPDLVLNTLVGAGPAIYAFAIGAEQESGA